MKTIKLTLTTTLFFFSTIVFITSPLGRTGGASLSAQNISINGTGAVADASAILDVASPTLGLLVPRVALTSITAATPVTSPATSLLVYNTATANTGTIAVSPGYYYWDGVKWVRFAYNASGNSANDWNTLGNAGTNPSTNFLGTTDAQDLVIKVNNAERIRIKQSTGSIWTNPNGTANTIIGNLTGNSITGNNNSFYGYRSGDLTTSGAQNTFLGAYTGITNTTGVSNTFLGYTAGYYNTGDNNTFLGAAAGFSTSTGIANTAVGTQAFQSNTTGGFNTAVGTNALFSNTIGSQNVANGYTALYSNLSGNYNIASGQGSLYYNTSGSNNVGYGFNTLRNNTTGNHNVAIGNTALDNSITGQANIGIGINSGLGNTTGSYNVFLGANADATGNNFTNATAIGFNSKVGQSNALILGGTGADAVNVGFQTTTPQTAIQVNDTSGRSLQIFNSGGLGYPYAMNISSGGMFKDPSSAVKTMKSFNASGTSGVAMITLEPNAGDIIFTANNTPVSTYSNYAWNPRMKIDGTTGFVGIGIGVTVPTEMLEIAGNVKATSFIATTVGAGAYKYNTSTNMTVPDYVFESYYDKNTANNPTYKLMPLTEVESYLQKNKHLPRVPSREELQKEKSVNLQGLTMVNLEKTEENTLYILELKKQNDLLEQQNSTQQQQINTLLKRIEALEKK